MKKKTGILSKIYIAYFPLFAHCRTYLLFLQQRKNYRLERIYIQMVYTAFS